MSKDGMRWLCNARNEIEAKMVTGILDSEGIANRIYEFGPGGVYHTSGLFGMEIQVAETEFEKANDILQAFFSNKAEIMETEGEPEGEETGKA